MAIVIDKTLRRILDEVKEEIYKKYKIYLSDETVTKILWSQSIGMKEAISNKKGRVRADGIGIFKIKVGREATLIVKKEIAAMGLRGEKAEEYIKQAKKDYKKNPKEFVKRKNDLPFTDFDEDNLNLQGEK